MVTIVDDVPAAELLVVKIPKDVELRKKWETSLR